MSKLKSKQNGAILTTKKNNLSDSEFAELQTIAMSNAQEIEEKVSKSFLAMDAFTPIQVDAGVSMHSGTGSGLCH
jgi:hypothetical protein